MGKNKTVRHRTSAGRRAIALVFFLTINPFLLPGRQQVMEFDGASGDPFKKDPGLVLVLIFLRTDCPISNRYAPLIQQMSVKYAKEAKFYLVFPDQAESATSINVYLEKYHYSVQGLRDPAHALVEKSGAKVTPEAAVFDKQRKLVYHGRIDNLYPEFGKSRRTATRHELAAAIEAAYWGVRPATESAAGIGCFIADLK
jgi:thiol-disulfide isomerase/thioredoxin